MNVAVAPVKTTYEPGMKISYDRVSMRAVVSFRGRIMALSQNCMSETEAVTQGEAHCRHLGWNLATQGNSARKFRSLW